MIRGHQKKNFNHMVLKKDNVQAKGKWEKIIHEYFNAKVVKKKKKSVQKRSEGLRKIPISRSL